MNITDYLKVDYTLFKGSHDTQFRLITRTVEVEKNLFHLPIPGYKERHFKLLIIAQQRDKSNEEWADAETYCGQIKDPLPFYFSLPQAYKEPTIQQISEIIYSECFAALMATHYPDRNKFDKGFYFVDRDTITLEDIYVYLKLRHKNYEQTRDFIRDYDHHFECLYNTLKWWHYLLGDLRGKTTYLRWEWPVGKKLLGFISPEDFPSEIKLLRERLK